MRRSASNAWMFWTAEATGPEAFATLGAVSAAAPGLDLATGVLALQLRTPPLLAMAGATVQALAPAAATPPRAPAGERILLVEDDPASALPVYSKVLLPDGTEPPSALYTTVSLKPGADQGRGTNLRRVQDHPGV